MQFVARGRRLARLAATVGSTTAGGARAHSAARFVALGKTHLRLPERSPAAGRVAQRVATRRAVAAQLSCADGHHVLTRTRFFYFEDVRPFANLPLLLGALGAAVAFATEKAHFGAAA